MTQEESGVLLTNDQTPDDKSTKQYDLIFPRSLISLTKDINKAYPSKLRLAKHLLLSYYFQLFIVFIVSLICLIVACTHHAYDYQYYMSRTVLILQAAFALVIVSLHLCISVSRSPSFLMTQFSFNQRHLIQYCVILSHLLTVFSIIWFFIGHIWLIPEIAYAFAWEFRVSSGTQLVIPMFILEYVIGIWLLYCCIRNNVRHLTQHRMSKEISNEINLRDTVKCEQAIENKAQSNDQSLNV
ncbi:unnamed protein product [Adineta ricciae]|uniref:Uncharacterized protein n=1 Tax=Adineta ricciae TaxID=249248 RepID=A0A816AEK3_ADIRI|nr:unnamed protein product [Adineta ricciae]CAF1596446.1 unnamed protein product [Adineta ricciae]